MDQENYFADGAPFPIHLALRASALARSRHGTDDAYYLGFVCGTDDIPMPCPFEESRQYLYEFSRGLRAGKRSRFQRKQAIDQHQKELFTPPFHPARR